MADKQKPFDEFRKDHRSFYNNSGVEASSYLSVRKSFSKFVGEFGKNVAGFAEVFANRIRTRAGELAESTFNPKPIKAIQEEQDKIFDNATKEAATHAKQMHDEMRSKTNAELASRIESLEKDLATVNLEDTGELKILDVMAGSVKPVHATPEMYVANRRTGKIRRVPRTTKEMVSDIFSISRTVYEAPGYTTANFFRLHEQLTNRAVAILSKARMKAIEVTKDTPSAGPGLNKLSYADERSFKAYLGNNPQFAKVYENYLKKFSRVAHNMSVMRTNGVTDASGRTGIGFYMGEFDKLYKPYGDPNAVQEQLRQFRAAETGQTLITDIPGTGFGARTTQKTLREKIDKIKRDIVTKLNVGVDGDRRAAVYKTADAFEKTIEKLIQSMEQKNIEGEFFINLRKFDDRTGALSIDLQVLDRINQKRTNLAISFPLLDTATGMSYRRSVTSPKYMNIGFELSKSMQIFGKETSYLDVPEHAMLNFTKNVGGILNELNEGQFNRAASLLKRSMSSTYRGSELATGTDIDFIKGSKVIRESAWSLLNRSRARDFRYMKGYESMQNYRNAIRQNAQIITLDIETFNRIGSDMSKGPQKTITDVANTEIYRMTYVSQDMKSKKVALARDVAIAPKNKMNLDFLRMMGYSEPSIQGIVEATKGRSAVGVQSAISTFISDIKNEASRTGKPIYVVVKNPSFDIRALMARYSEKDPTLASIKIIDPENMARAAYHTSKMDYHLEELAYDLLEQDVKNEITKMTAKELAEYSVPEQRAVIKMVKDKLSREPTAKLTRSEFINVLSAKVSNGFAKHFQSPFKMEMGWHNPIMDTSQLVYMMEKIMQKAGMTDDQIARRLAEARRFSQSTMNDVSTVERALTMLGPTGDKIVTPDGVEHEPSGMSLSPGALLKGFTTNMNIYDIFPYGVLWSGTKQLYQRMGGSQVKWSQDHSSYAKEIGPGAYRKGVPYLTTRGMVEMASMREKMGLPIYGNYTLSKVAYGVTGLTEQESVILSDVNSVPYKLRRASRFHESLLTTHTERFSNVTIDDSFFSMPGVRRSMYWAPAIKTLESDIVEQLKKTLSSPDQINEFMALYRAEGRKVLYGNTYGALVSEITTRLLDEAKEKTPTLKSRYMIGGGNTIFQGETYGQANLLYDYKWKGRSGYLSGMAAEYDQERDILKYRFGITEIGEVGVGSKVYAGSSKGIVSGILKNENIHIYGKGAGAGPINMFMAPKWGAAPGDLMESLILKGVAPMLDLMYNKNVGMDDPRIQKFKGILEKANLRLQANQHFGSNNVYEVLVNEIPVTQYPTLPKLFPVIDELLRASGSVHGSEVVDHYRMLGHQINSPKDIPDTRRKALSIMKSNINAKLAAKEITEENAQLQYMMYERILPEQDAPAYTTLIDTALSAGVHRGAYIVAPGKMTSHLEVTEIGKRLKFKKPTFDRSTGMWDKALRMPIEDISHIMHDPSTPKFVKEKILKSANLNYLKPFMDNELSPFVGIMLGLTDKTTGFDRVDSQSFERAVGMLSELETRTDLTKNQMKSLFEDDPASPGNMRLRKAFIPRKAMEEGIFSPAWNKPYSVAIPEWIKKRGGIEIDVVRALTGTPMEQEVTLLNKSRAEAMMQRLGITTPTFNLEDVFPMLPNDPFFTPGYRPEIKQHVYSSMGQRDLLMKMREAIVADKMTNLGGKERDQLFKEVKVAANNYISGISGMMLGRKGKFGGKRYVPFSGAYGTYIEQEGVLQTGALWEGLPEKERAEWKTKIEAISGVGNKHILEVELESTGFASELSELDWSKLKQGLIVRKPAISFVQPAGQVGLGSAVIDMINIIPRKHTDRLGIRQGQMSGIIASKADIKAQGRDFDSDAGAVTYGVGFGDQTTPEQIQSSPEYMKGIKARAAAATKELEPTGWGYIKTPVSIDGGMKESHQFGLMKGKTIDINSPNYERDVIESIQRYQTQLGLDDVITGKSEVARAIGGSIVDPGPARLAKEMKIAGIGKYAIGFTSQGAKKYNMLYRSALPELRRWDPKLADLMSMEGTSAYFAEAVGAASDPIISFKHLTDFESQMEAVKRASMMETPESLNFLLKNKKVISGMLERREKLKANNVDVTAVEKAFGLMDIPEGERGIYISRKIISGWKDFVDTSDISRELIGSVNRLTFDKFHNPDLIDAMNVALANPGPDKMSAAGLMKRTLEKFAYDRNPGEASQLYAAASGASRGTSIFRDFTFKERASRNWGIPEATIQKVARYSGVAALGFLGLNMLRPNQLSNSANPLDLFGSLEPVGQPRDFWSDTTQGTLSLPTGAGIMAPKLIWNKSAYLELQSPISQDNVFNRLGAMIGHKNASKAMMAGWENPQMKFYQSMGRSNRKSGNLSNGNYGSFADRSGAIPV